MNTMSLAESLPSNVSMLSVLEVPLKPVGILIDLCQGTGFEISEAENSHKYPSTGKQNYTYTLGNPMTDCIQTCFSMFNNKN